ncbi:MAG: VWA domain-containing protein [Acidobacteriota bacterium]
MMNKTRSLLALLLSVAIGAESADRRSPIPATSADFAAEARLTLVPVSVVDREGSAVIGLRKEHFSVFDNSEQQAIHSFAREDAPAMLGVILDVSGSMVSRLPQALDAVHAVLNAVGEADGGFLISFADAPRLIGAFPSDLRSLLDLRRLPLPNGDTALIDAAYEGLTEARRIRHKRSVLLIVSDGGDNASRHTESDLRSLAKEADTQVYSISISGRNRTNGERFGSYLLEDLSKLTGGLHFHANDRHGLPEIAEKIALAMKNIYVIGYQPPQRADGGKWRKIRVTLSEDVRKAKTVAARKGYYAPE